MAQIYNFQPVVGVRVLDEGATIFNNQPVVGVRYVDEGVLFTGGKLVLGVEDRGSNSATIYNDAPLLGVVVISDARTIYNNREVIPVYGSGGGAPAPTVSRGIIGNRFQAATTAITIAANFTSRRSHYASTEGDVSNIQCLDVGWYMSQGGPIAGSGARIKRYVEYPAGVFHRVTWGGATDVRIEGDLTTVVVSDVVLSSVTGGPLAIAAGDRFFERTVNLNASQSGFPVTTLPAGCAALGLPDGNSTSDLGNSGTIPATSTANTFGAACMIGDIANGSARSVSAFGDSICFGQGDITTVGKLGGSGYIARMLDELGLPYFKCAYPGQAASELAASHNALEILLSHIPVTDAIYEHGVNDLRIGRPLNSLLADMQTLYAMSGAPRKWQMTITPRTESTDGWATVEGQTGRTDGTMSVLNALNGTIRSGVANITGLVDAADAAMSGRDSDLWGGPFPATTDGTHPTSQRAAAMALYCAPQFAA